ncbi:MAG: MFS transporter [Vicinamibacterales bacterium]
MPNASFGGTARSRNIVALLTIFSFVSYLERTNISVAAKFMMPELGLTQIQMGQIFSSFLLGYSLFQIPAGILGDTLGPRKVLAMAGVTWAATTALTGLLPGFVIPAAAAAYLTLWVIRFALGAGQAAMYPVAARAIANWIAPTNRAFANSVVIAGASLGSAVAGPLISWLMVAFGWRASFYVTGAIALGIAAVWWQYGSDYPPGTSGGFQAARIVASNERPTAPGARGASWWPLFRNRDMLLLSASYFLASYVLYIFVFWLYLYLVDVRGFSLLRGGLFASLPWLVATVLTPAGGAVADWLSRRLGSGRGHRITAAGGLALSGIFLYLGATAPGAYLAIAALSLSIGFQTFTEGAFWSSATDIAGTHAGAAGGVMNTFGNLGGVVSTALMPVLIQRFGWTAALSSGTVAIVIAAFLWFLIRPEGRRVQPA